ncbi:MAG: 16S rRNA (adenine(1518)-N(6)/adenine(1519)-N(6))-dimethyltransferase RsmA, partial [Sulfuricaulis sp.]
HSADALKFDFCRLAPDGRQLRLVGNLPYNISTPLLFHLLDQAHCIRDMLFMLQKEVVQHLGAAPGGKDYGRLSVMIQYRCAVEKLFDVAPGAFTPAPRVDSAVVRLVPHAAPPVTVKDTARFAHIVRASFASRRKTLRNNLKGLLEAGDMLGLGIDPTRRAETLSLAEFAALSNATTTAP